VTHNIIMIHCCVRLYKALKVRLVGLNFGLRPYFSSKTLAEPFAELKLRYFGSAEV